jgi:adhesin/invasin
MSAKMLGESMITRLCLARLPWLSAAALLCFAAVACEKVPLLAPSGSTITLTAATNALSVNGTADIIAQLIEPSGTPPHSGTRIIFTTTLGTIQPAEAETDINGRAVVKFNAGAANGNAVISASSGATSTGPTGSLRIAVGTAAVGRITMNADPATVPATGGATRVTASVLDINGNILAGTPVSFTTTAGSLSSPVVTTDANGNASTTLTTGQQAVVTATVGAQGGSGTTPPATGTPGTTPPATNPTGQASAQVTVTVAAAPSLVITPPSTPPSAGLPAAFTFAVTVAATGGSAVRDVTVDWGDFSPPQSLGAISGNAVVSHVYRTPGTYIVRATVTDASGNSNPISTSVTVIPVPRPTIIVTPTPASGSQGLQVTFQIRIDVPSGIAVQSAFIDFGDGQGQGLGGASGIITGITHKYPSGPGSIRDYIVVVTVTDSTNTTTSGTAIVSITN